MTALTRPRGPLPARVYWTRRLVLLAVSVLLVAGIARVLGSGSDASSDPDKAAPVAADTADRSSQSQDPSSAAASPSAPQSSATAKPAPAQPDGPCLDEDIVVTPVVQSLVGGSGSAFPLEVTTREAAACTWRVSSASLTVKITSGSDGIWFSRQCPTAIPTRDLIVRQASAVKVWIRWSGRRSDAACGSDTDWAMPGGYHVEAAALAGEPTKDYFDLVAPAGKVITRTVTPDPEPKSTTKPKPRSKPQPNPQRAPQPTGQPSGAVEPNG